MRDLVVAQKEATRAELDAVELEKNAAIKNLEVARCLTGNANKKILMLERQIHTLKESLKLSENKMEECVSAYCAVK